MRHVVDRVVAAEADADPAHRERRRAGTGAARLAGPGTARRNRFGAPTVRVGGNRRSAQPKTTSRSVYTICIRPPGKYMSRTSSPIPLVSSCTCCTSPKITGRPRTNSAPSTGPVTDPRPPMIAVDDEPQRSRRRERRGRVDLRPQRDEEATRERRHPARQRERDEAHTRRRHRRCRRHLLVVAHRDHRSADTGAAQPRDHDREQRTGTTGTGSRTARRSAKSIDPSTGGRVGGVVELNSPPVNTAWPNSQLVAATPNANVITASNRPVHAQRGNADDHRGDARRPPSTATTATDPRQASRSA